jgi:hypothetical protein
MARGKTTLVAGSAEAEASPERTEEWGICPGCGRERRIELGSILVQHRVWQPAPGAMVDCPGSGRPAARIDA